MTRVISSSDIDVRIASRPGDAAPIGSIGRWQRISYPRACKRRANSSARVPFGRIEQFTFGSRAITWVSGCPSNPRSSMMRTMSPRWDFVAGFGATVAAFAGDVVVCVATGCGEDRGVARSAIHFHKRKMTSPATGMAIRIAIDRNELRDPSSRSCTARILRRGPEVRVQNAEL